MDNVLNEKKLYIEGHPYTSLYADLFLDSLSQLSRMVAEGLIFSQTASHQILQILSDQTQYKIHEVMNRVG